MAAPLKLKMDKLCNPIFTMDTIVIHAVIKLIRVSGMGPCYTKFIEDNIQEMQRDCDRNCIQLYNFQSVI